MSKKVMIVFEETEGVGIDAKGNPGAKFNVYLAGDVKNIEAGNPEAALSAAEFWGWRMFNIVKQVMAQAGSFDPKNPLQHNQEMKQ